MGGWHIAMLLIVGAVGALSFAAMFGLRVKLSRRMNRAVFWAMALVCVLCYSGKDDANDSNRFSGPPMRRAAERGGQGASFTAYPSAPGIFPTDLDLTATNLCFKGIQPTPTSVWLNVAWPPGLHFAHRVIDIFSRGSLSSNDAWSAIGVLPVFGCASNAVTEILKSDLPVNASPESCFFLLGAETDTDGDGLSDDEETSVHHTDPRCADTDGDGDPDGWEVERGFDPNDDSPRIVPTFAALTNHVVPVKFGFHDMVTVRHVGNPASASAPPRLAAPAPLVTDGLPQIPFTDSQDPHNEFYQTTTGLFTPRITGTYEFVLSADDNASFTVGGVSASVTWEADAGAERRVTGRFACGVAYPVSIAYDNHGAYDYFLSCGYRLVESEGAGDPDLKVEPDRVVFSLQAGDDLSVFAPAVSLDGDLDPDGDYSIAVEASEGLVVRRGAELADIKVFPDAAYADWVDGKEALATYRLLKNGEEINSEECLFICEMVKDESDGCDCGEGTKVENGCVSFSQAFGRSPLHPGIPVGRVVVRESRPVPALYTPAALRFDHPMMRRIRYLRNLDARVVDGLGRVSEYRRGHPYGVSSGGRGQLFMDALGRIVEELPDGLRVIYDATGAVVALQSEFGSPIPVAALGITVDRAADGTIASVASVADGTMSAAPAGTNAWRLVWTSPAGLPVKRFDFSGDGETTFMLREYRSEAFQFDTVWTYDDALRDFRMVKGGVRNRRSMRYDPDSRRWTSTLSWIDENGGTTSSSSVTLDRDGHGIRPTSRRDLTSGRELYSATLDSDGRVAAERDSLGECASYAYDRFGRITATTIVASGVPTRTVVNEYTDAIYPVDFRPARSRTFLDGELFLEEGFEYGTAASGNCYSLQARICGGVARRSYREYDANGRMVLSVAENGRATRTGYAATNGGGVVETSDEGVVADWDGGAPGSPMSGFTTVDGRSMRTVRHLDSAGNAVRVERHALVGGEWRALDWETHAYNATHKIVSSAYSDGTTDAADWICTGPVWRTDRGGVTVSNEYDSAKQLSASTRYGAFGAVRTDYVHDSEGRVVGEIASAANCETQSVRRVYDSRGRVVSETDAHGVTTLREYSADDLTNTVINADGGTVVTVCNGDGSVASVSGTAVMPQFHAYGVAEMSVGGRRVPCRIEEVRHGRADSPRFTRTYTDGFGDVVLEERAGFGGVVNIQDRFYDGHGQLVLQTETGLPTIEYAYDVYGDCIAETVSAGNETRTTATARAFVLEDGTVFESTTTTRTCSDSAIAPLVENRCIRRSGLTLALNDCIIATDMRGNVTIVRRAVDPTMHGRVETIARPDVSNVATNWYVDDVIVSNVSHYGICEQRRFDAYRRETAWINGRGNMTSRSYNPQGRLARIIDVTGAETGYAYDVMGRIVEVTNALDQISTRTYDLRGNLISEGGAVYPVCHSYNVYGERVSLTTFRDASTQTGDTTIWTRDSATGLVTAKTYADGHGTTYTYDAHGRLTSRTWARGIVATYAYDGWGSLVSTTYSDDTPSVVFAYDALGRKTSVVDAAGITTFAYDEYGEAASETWGGLSGCVLARHRDVFGRDTGYSVNGVRRTTIGYDAATGRIATMDADGTFSWQYLSGTGLKSRVVYPNDINVDYTYEQHRDLLIGVRNHLYETDFSVYVYTNDELGRRISKNGELYGYNERGELTSATGNGSYAYLYDDIGNLRTSAECGENSVYTANNLNQYTQLNRTIGQSDQSNIYSPVYDLDGNQTLVRTSTGVWQVAYNGENRPVRWVRGNTVVTMDFDSMGRRTFCRETENGVEVSSSRFFYDGYLMIQQLGFVTPHVVQKEFIWDPTEPVATKPLVFRQNGMDSTYLTHDGNKNVTDVIRAAPYNDSVGHYEYAPFGKVMSQMGTRVAGNPFRFSSEYADDTLGVVYYNYRHYEPLTGRWLNRDPIEEYRDDNLYLFCSCSPEVYFDVIGAVSTIFHRTNDNEISMFPKGIWGLTEIGNPKLVEGQRYYDQIRRVCGYLSGKGPRFVIVVKIHVPKEGDVVNGWKVDKKFADKIASHENKHFEIVKLASENYLSPAADRMSSITEGGMTCKDCFQKMDKVIYDIGQYAIDLYSHCERVVSAKLDGTEVVKDNRWLWVFGNYEPVGVFDVHSVMNDYLERMNGESK